ncbi:hypothetical protein [Chryseobacterium oryctis]|uniref:Lipoprotein n=1 Tax=Chryseobacterium oryctis TaxID=2952618 RepID=A0ABT3HNU6_9FLAO|nr:hypothetical protein [Chryseobacterium oryctis]MCW3161467.1 hypothetical protein [Chryseobacterium oryctis]
MSKQIKKILFLHTILFLLISCKYQSQGLIDKKLEIDKEIVNEEFYHSKTLNDLFHIQDATYFEPDYVGTSFPDYNVKDIVVHERSGNKKYYLLFFDKNNFLRDTLQVKENEIYSLNVIFSNNRKGLSVGNYNENNSYFKIIKNFELDKNIKVKSIPIDTKIINCPIPIELLSEENLDLENTFKFGIKDFSKSFIDKKDENKNLFEKVKWKGDYEITTKAISDFNNEEFNLSYYINISSDNSAILSIGAKHSEDYWCEGDYNLKKDGNIIHARGKCDQDDRDDFYIKFENSKYYIKSKRFINKDWQELKKE